MTSKTTLNKLPRLSFKFRLNRNISKTPGYYNNSGSRKGQIMHSRIRMECSSLTANLFKKNIVAYPSYHYGSFGSPLHFFFDCSRYDSRKNKTLTQQSYEGRAKRSVTNRLPWFYPRYILKCFTALEWCVE